MAKPTLPPRKWYNLQQAADKLTYECEGLPVTIDDLLHYAANGMLELCVYIDYLDLDGLNIHGQQYKSTNVNEENKFKKGAEFLNYKIKLDYTSDNIKLYKKNPKSFEKYKNKYNEDEIKIDGVIINSFHPTLKGEVYEGVFNNKLELVKYKGLVAIDDIYLKHFYSPYQPIAERFIEINYSTSLSVSHQDDKIAFLSFFSITFNLPQTKELQGNYSLTCYHDIPKQKLNSLNGLYQVTDFYLIPISSLLITNYELERFKSGKARNESTNRTISKQIIGRPQNEVKRIVLELAKATFERHKKATKNAIAIKLIGHLQNYYSEFDIPNTKTITNWLTEEKIGYSGNNPERARDVNIIDKLN